MRYIHLLAFHALVIVLLLAASSLAAAQGNSESLPKLLPKAQAGDAEAQYRLGLLYRFAPIPEHDLHQSTKWFRAAAKQGHRPAMVGLTYALPYGFDGDSLYQQALKESADWFQTNNTPGGDSAVAQFHLDMAAWFQQAQTRAAKWFVLENLATADKTAATKDIHALEAAYEAIERAGPLLSKFILSAYKLDNFYKGCDGLGVLPANTARHERWRKYAQETQRGVDLSAEQLGVTTAAPLASDWIQGPRVQLYALLHAKSFGMSDMKNARALLKKFPKDIPEGSLAQASLLLLMSRRAGGLGLYGESLEYADRALRVFERERLPSSIGSVLGIKGYVLLATGQYAKATEAFSAALKARESRRDPEQDVQQALLLQRLGDLALLEGKPEQAEQKFRRMFAITSVQYGEFGLLPTRQFVQLPMEAQVGLARSLAASGRREEARRIYVRILSVVEAVPNLSGALLGRAYVYAAELALQEGRNADAQRLAREFLHHAPETDPQFFAWRANAQDIISRAAQHQGDAATGLAAAREADRIRMGMLSLVMTLPDEKAKRVALAKEHAGLVQLAELAMNQAAGPEVQRVEALYAAWLGRKALYFDSQLKVQQRTELGLTGEALAIAGELRQIRSDLARVVFSPANPGSESPPKDVAVLEARRQELVRRQAAQVVERLAPDAPPVEPADLPIPEGTLLVDIMRLTEGTSPGYYAFLGRKGQPFRLVRVGGVAEMDTAAREWLRLIAKGSGPPPERVRAGAGKAFQSLLGPLGPELSRTDHLLLVPDGLFQFLPLDTLMDESGTFLAERMTVRHLTSARELLHHDEPATKGPALILANPAFAAAGPRQPLAATKTGGQDSSDRLRGGRSATLTFSELPGTEREAQQVAAALGGHTRVLTGRAATKAALLNLTEPPKELHIATHAFFLGGQLPQTEASPATSFRGLVVENTPGQVSIRVSMDRLASPLLRAGLAFAGVGGADGPSQGILTAEEALGLRLRGTRLVTLSACETGLGDIAQDDEVYGLRRAFRLAGAEHLVVSLWKVPDEATARLMTDFYKGFGRGLDVDEALTHAKRKAIQAARDKGGFAFPRDWGGFISF